MEKDSGSKLTIFESPNLICYISDGSNEIAVDNIEDIDKIIDSLLELRTALENPKQPKRKFNV